MQRRIQDFSLWAKSEAPRAESGEGGWWWGVGGSLGGAATFLGLGAVPQQGSGRNPDRPKVSTIFSTQDGLS